MRESNFAFPGQNRACVCISSQLYDRRALDTLCPLPLFNSLTHLTYLTSTSPRIREIMTMDGGLERLVRILHDFCISPPLPENPSLIYGLAPPSSRPPKSVPTLAPHQFDRHAAYRFSLAFQCVVNIGVRGSEPIRSRVVQAGTLDVVGCILEAWLVHKGFAVGPSASATGMPRESREQRLARRQAQRSREEALELARALERQIQVAGTLHVDRDITVTASNRHNAENEHDGSSASGRSAPSRPTPSHVIRFGNRGSPSPDTDLPTSADTSIATTPVGSSTPTGSVVIPGRDRSGTVIGPRVWDEPAPRARQSRPLQRQTSPSGSASPPPSTDTSRPETETEDDDVDMDRPERHDVGEVSPSPGSRHDGRLLIQRPRRAVGIVSDGPVALPVNADAHIMIGDGDGTVGRPGVMRVEDGIVLLEPNDDFAMGAPPGAPGAITIEDGATPRNMDMRVGEQERVRNRAAPDVTPRAGVANLPPANIPDGETGGVGVHRGGTIRGIRGGTFPPTQHDGVPAGNAQGGRGPGLGLTMNRASSTHYRTTMDISDAAPYRDEDVLLSLQLLAYLSKYPHVRQAFYKPRVTFHPATANLGTRGGAGGAGRGGTGRSGTEAGGGSTSRSNLASSTMLGRDTHSFFKAFTSAGRGKEKEKMMFGSSSASSSSGTSSSSASTSTSAPTRQTNVFSLVERFTFRPSSTESDLPNPPPKLPTEIQYWAGVIMRNACRKDESRGGIRQCANMLCGRWESYPREFAKCRRCRKAKYCGKECQSTAWSEGHRFWCSAKDGDEEVPEHTSGDQTMTNGDPPGGEATTNAPVNDVSGSGGAAGPVWDRSDDRTTGRERTLGAGAESTTRSYRTVVNGVRGTGAHSMAVNGAVPGPSGSGSNGHTVGHGTVGHRGTTRGAGQGHRNGEGTGLTGGYSLFSRHTALQAEQAPRRPWGALTTEASAEETYERIRQQLEELERNGANLNDGDAMMSFGLGRRDDDGSDPSRNAGDHDMILG